VVVIVSFFAEIEIQNFEVELKEPL